MVKSHPPETIATNQSRRRRSCASSDMWSQLFELLLMLLHRAGNTLAWGRGRSVFLHEHTHARDWQGGRVYPSHTVGLPDMDGCRIHRIRSFLYGILSFRMGVLLCETSYTKYRNTSWYRKNVFEYHGDQTFNINGQYFIQKVWSSHNVGIWEAPQKV